MPNQFPNQFNNRNPQRYQAMPNQFPNQFYNRDPRRYQAECAAVYQTLRAMNPQGVTLRDGRRGFILTVSIPDPKGDTIAPDGVRCRRYRVLGAWDADHPHSASQRFGGSVRWYFISPTIEQMEREFRSATGHPVPHLLTDAHPGKPGQTTHIPCVQRIGMEDTSFSFTEATTLLVNWVSAFTVALRHPTTGYPAFARE